MSHETASEGRLLYSETLNRNDSYYLNLVKDMSWLNSRNHQHTDKDGHVIGYWVDLTISLDEASAWTFSTAPNTWKMRNSFRKFHALRDHMFREAGVTKSEMGKYGRTIRPYLEPGMVEVTDDAGSPVVYEEKNVLSPAQANDAKREWTYTSLASNPGWLEEETIQDISGQAKGMSLADEWKLTITGENNPQSNTDDGVLMYYSAGMIHSYNLDRMEVVTPDAEEVISGPNNPLASLRFQGPASGEVVDIAEDQELEAPPYDITDAGDSIEIVFADLARTNNATLSIVKVRNLFVPAGILRVAMGNTASGTASPSILAEVKGWSYCKDLA